MWYIRILLRNWALESVEHVPALLRLRHFPAPPLALSSSLLRGQKPPEATLREWDAKSSVLSMREKRNS